MSKATDLLGRSRVLAMVRAALGSADAWLVGGSLRDLILGRPLEDVDLVVSADAEGAARRLARATGAHLFPLSERFGAWRVIAPARDWQADVTPARGGSIEADLALRDFTINALALPLDGEARIIDPHGGLADLERRLLRVVSKRSYRDDPLRTLRMARLASELSLEVEGETADLAREHVSEIVAVAPERTFYELKKLVVCDDPLRGIELMDAAGLVAAVLPELSALKGVEQNPYHHLDVWGHTLTVLAEQLELERDLSAAFGTLGEAIGVQLQLPLADDLTRGQALRFAALFHDLGKPATRKVSEEGRVLFWGHDELGARMSITICRRLHASTMLGDYLAVLARHHLRLGFLVHERPLSRRQVYTYLRACEPVELEVTLLSVADRLATRGERTRTEAVGAHLGLAAELAEEALAWRKQGPPKAPLRGNELIDELGIEAGPEVGRLLEALREASFAGEVSTRQEALAYARKLAS